MTFPGSFVGPVVRRLLSTPLFTIVAIVTLAVGIGANAAMFSIINGVLLKPLPFADPDRLVGVWHTAPGLNFPLLNQAPSFHYTYEELGQTFERIGMWDRTSVSVTGLERPERVVALLVTEGTLPALGVEPALGRLFTREDDSPAGPERVLLTDAYWRRRFGGDPSVLGRGLTIDGQPREIIGVLPADFRFLGFSPELVVPFRFDRSKLFVGNFSYQGLARLKPGATIEQANADVGRLMTIVPDRFPMPPGFTLEMFKDARLGPNVRPLARDLTGDNIDRVLWLLLATVGVVLIIACANVANLFLVRAEVRQRELAVRAALGASRGRLTRELLTESILLSLAGGAVGLVLASGAIRGLIALAPQSLPRLDEIAIDPIVIGFTLLLSIAAGVLFGAIPVLKYTRPRIVEALVEGGRSVSDGRSRHAVRNALVVSQIALALILLVASGLMIRTFVAMQRVPPGFVRPEEVLTMRLSIPDGLIKSAEQTALAHEQIVRKLEQIPGVTSVGLTTSVPMDGSNSNDPIFVEDFSTPEGQIPTLRRFKWVSENYFSTIGSPVLAGRAITWSDIHSFRPVCVVSENFARQYWKTPADAIGKRIRQTPKNPWREIVGVVGDERDDGVNRAAPVVVYWPMMMKEFWFDEIFIMRSMVYAVRSERLGAPTFLEDIQKAVWSLQPDVPLATVRPLTAVVQSSMAQTSFALIMLALAGGVALVLGLVGIYGVIAYIAAQRTREIGIRMALGAQRTDVVGLFLRHGLVLSGIGIALGVLGAGGATRLMSTLLFGVEPLDLATFATVSAALGAIALLATYLPARRASRVDPVHALRGE
jgi:predicted permease